VGDCGTEIIDEFSCLLRVSSSIVFIWAISPVFERLYKSLNISNHPLSLFVQFNSLFNHSFSFSSSLFSALSARSLISNNKHSYFSWTLLTSFSRTDSRAIRSSRRRSCHFESISLNCYCKVYISWSFWSTNFCINSGSWELCPLEISSKFILRLEVSAFVFVCELAHASFGSFTAISLTSIFPSSALSSLSSIRVYYTLASWIFLCFLCQWIVQREALINWPSPQILHYRAVMTLSADIIIIPKY
jgi:hypothetical protein